jgi:thioredoxin reductase (NADPH)
MEKYDVIIIGAGPGGATAGIYVKRQGLNVVLIEKNVIGGQLAESPEIENYPGFPKISGMEYGENIKKHLEHLEIPVIFGEVTDIKKTEEGFNVIVHDKEYFCKSVILATGTTHKKLDAEGEKDFYGKGISYCATCDGFFFKGKDVAVVGGGNSAFYYVDYLSNIASNVYLVHRRKGFRAEPVIVDKVSKKPNVKLFLDSVVHSFLGKEVLEKIKIENVLTKELSEIKVSGVFISIGETPNISLAKKLNLNIDEKGYIKTNDVQATNVKGIYACGDVCGKGWAQALNASAQGMVAGLDCSDYVRKQ